MEPNKSEESGEMYLPNEQGEHAPEVGTELLSPGIIRCLNCPGNCDRGVAPIRGVCPTTRGNDGRPPRVPVPTHILVECGHQGTACSQK